MEVSVPRSFVSGTLKCSVPQTKRSPFCVWPCPVCLLITKERTHILSRSRVASQGREKSWNDFLLSPRLRDRAWGCHYALLPLMKHSRCVGYPNTSELFGGHTTIAPNSDGEAPVPREQLSAPSILWREVGHTSRQYFLRPRPMSPAVCTQSPPVLSWNSSLEQSWA